MVEEREWCDTRNAIDCLLNFCSEKLRKKALFEEISPTRRISKLPPKIMASAIVANYLLNAYNKTQEELAMSMSSVGEFLFLICIAAIVFSLKRFLSDATLTRKGEIDRENRLRPPDCVNEAFDEINNPAKSANLGNIFHRHDNT